MKARLNSGASMLDFTSIPICASAFNAATPACGAKKMSFQCLYSRLCCIQDEPRKTFRSRALSLLPSPFLYRAEYVQLSGDPDLRRHAQLL